MLPASGCVSYLLYSILVYRGELLIDISADTHTKPNRSPAKRVRFEKEERRNERALTYKISRSKRYVACSDVVRAWGLEPQRIAAREPKSRMSTNSIIPAGMNYFIITFAH